MQYLKRLYTHATPLNVTGWLATIAGLWALVLALNKGDLAGEWAASAFLLLIIFIIPCFSANYIIHTSPISSRQKAWLQWSGVLLYVIAIWWKW